MTKKEAQEAAESAPEPVQSLLEELIERTFKEPKKRAPRPKKVSGK